MKAIFCLLLITATVYGQNPDLDSLEKRLASAPTVENRIDILNKLSHTYSTLSIGRAEQLAKEALHLSQSLNYARGIASSYNNLGICYSIRGDYAAGLDYFIQSLRLRQSMNDPATVASTLSNIARVFRYQHDYDQALEYGLQALDASRSVNNPVQLGHAYINVGNIYMDKKNFPLALTMFSTANDLFETRSLKVEQGWALLEIARVYDALGNYPEALSTALRAEKVIDAKHDVFSALELLQLTGSIYHHMGKLIEGKRLLQRAIAMADSSNDSNGRITSRRKLADMYRENGKLDSALHYQDQCLSLNAQIFNIEKARQLADLEKIYQTESKDRELSDKNQQLRFQTTVISIISVLLLVLAVLGYMSYHYYVEKRRSARKLEKLNDEISNKHVEMLYQAEQLSKANEQVRRINESLEQEVQNRSNKIRQQNQMLIEYAYFNAHNVRGPLARILGLAGLMQAETSVELIKEYNTRLHESALELDLVVREINTKLQYDC